MTRSIVFDPLVDWSLISALVIVALGLVGFALWRGLRGWPLRALAFAALGLGLANPALQEEQRKPLSDIVILVVDDSASQRLADRQSQTEAAIAGIRAEVAALENTELRVVRLGDGPRHFA